MITKAKIENTTQSSHYTEEPDNGILEIIRFKDISGSHALPEYDDHSFHKVGSWKGGCWRYTLSEYAMYNSYLLLNYVHSYSNRSDGSLCRIIRLLETAYITICGASV